MLKDKCSICCNCRPIDDKKMACFCDHYNAPIADSEDDECKWFNPVYFLDEDRDRDIIDEWFKEAGKMTPENLPEFIRHLSKDYYHDYGTICHAMAAVGIAAMWAFNNGPSGGITGFQAGCVMWDVIRQWCYRNNKTGLKIIDYDNMLYPQYERRFDKKIRFDMWEAIQSEARKRLNESSNANEKVKDHWRSIVDGEVPFGYEVEYD